YDLGCRALDHWYPTLALVLLRRLNPGLAAHWTGGTLRLNYAGPPGETYPQYSYRMVYQTPQCFARGRLAHCPGVRGTDYWDALRGKVVFLGRTDTLGNTDLFDNPLGGAQSLPGVEIHATALNTLINDDPIRVLPGALQLLLTVTLALGLAA